MSGTLPGMINGGTLLTSPTTLGAEERLLAVGADGQAAAKTAAAVRTMIDFTAQASAAAPVQSVNGQTGAVTLAAADVGAATASHSHAQSDVTNLVSDLAAKVPTSRTISAGTGLTGGGNLSADRSFAVVYGTGSGTACEGNDSRLSNSRTPTAHATSHQSGESDAIKLDDLAAPDDNTDLDATTGRHGLLPKLGGGTTNYLRADGAWASPSSGGGVTIDRQVFTSSGTWTKPANARFCDVSIFPAGGGGACGARGANGTTRRGGGAGASGSPVFTRLSASILGATESVVVGAGGAGAAGRTSDNLDAGVGTNGGTTSFGAHISAIGGPGGFGWGGGVGQYNSGNSMGTMWAGVTGADGGNAGAGGSGQTSGLGPGSGGGGGSLNGSNTAFGGGNAGQGSNIRNAVSNGTPNNMAGTGPAGGSAGNNGTSGASRSLSGFCGDGGGGGGASSSGVGGSGGNGGIPGGGGGGGGASANGNVSGPGGNGGRGEVIIETWCWA